MSTETKEKDECPVFTLHAKMNADGRIICSVFVDGIELIRKVGWNEALIRLKKELANWDPQSD